IARYSNNQFVLFIKEETAENILSFVKNIRLELANTTLKSKSGLMFKTSFNFGVAKYSAAQDFQPTIEKAASLSRQEKETLKRVI
ncbi:MAG: hypothetical protein OQK77_14625, partial [Psychromonas sp.]|nr:hypothetical protein [Psychromonas sp.]